MRNWLLLILCLAAGVGQAQSTDASPSTPSRPPITIRFRPLPREVVQQRLALVKKLNEERQFVLEGLLTNAGCPIQRSPVPGELPDILCVLPGSTDRVIVLGAHFDHVKKGDGAVDNWSGAALLPSVYESLKALRPRHTIVFAGFSAEEKGLLGSKAYVGSLPTGAKSKIAAMINLDTLGLSSTKVWSNRATPLLVNALFNVAQALQLPLDPMNVDAKGASADSESFFGKDVPAITIHSVTLDTWSVLHSSRDTLEQIKPNEYYDTYKLVLGYIVFLDQLLDAPAAVDGVPAS